MAIFYLYTVYVISKHTVIAELIQYHNEDSMIFSTFCNKRNPDGCQSDRRVSKYIQYTLTLMRVGKHLTK